MAILDQSGFGRNLEPFGRAHGLALEHLMVIHSASSDMRWALLTLACRSCMALFVLAQERLVRNVANRRKALLAPDCRRC